MGHREKAAAIRSGAEGVPFVSYSKTTPASQFNFYTPFGVSAYSTSFQKTPQDTSGILNVKVYPIPVTDEMNVSYHIDKDALVTIELRDFLGKKLFTLLSRRVPAGEQKNSFSLGTKLNNGLYFLRILVAGQPRAVKKIYFQGK